MIDISQFINKYYPHASIQKIDDVRRFILNLQDLIQDSNMVESLADQQILCRSFYLQKNSGVSRVNYLKIKDYLLNIADYLGCSIVVPTHRNVVSFNDTRSYFEDLDALLGAIDRVGSAVLTGYRPNVDLLRVKAIAILGWYGASIQDIADFKANRIHDQGISMPDERNPNKFIALPPSHYEPLYLLTTISSYKAMPTGREQKFTGDETMLLRPTRSDCDVLPFNQITQILTKFNQCVPAHINIAISFRNLRKNALFVEIYKDDKDEALYKKIMRHMNCDIRMSFAYQEEYSRWLNLYHQEA